jgi:hypothetical protein
MRIMNAAELYSNYSNAVEHYAETSGDANAVFKLGSAGDGKIQITDWKSSVPQPSESQLLAIPLAAVTVRATRKAALDRLRNGILLSLTSAQISNLLNGREVVGMEVFNTTLNAPQVYTATGWKTYTLS